mmetsp:Transcript_57849/g.113878  ORF Transcript_57849/g.113878 Transcript_57849/m.113878 type:complete len:255 (-) Transcript_57849:828-1592(-)
MTIWLVGTKTQSRTGREACPCSFAREVQFELAEHLQHVLAVGVHLPHLLERQARARPLRGHQRWAAVPRHVLEQAQTGSHDLRQGQVRLHAAHAHPDPFVKQHGVCPVEVVRQVLEPQEPFHLHPRVGWVLLQCTHHARHQALAQDFVRRFGGHERQVHQELEGLFLDRRVGLELGHDRVDVWDPAHVAQLLGVLLRVEAQVDQPLQRVQHRRLRRQNVHQRAHRFFQGLVVAQRRSRPKATQPVVHRNPRRQR